MTDPDKQKRIEILLAWGAAAGIALGTVFDLSVPRSLGDFIGAAFLAAVFALTVLIPWKLTTQYTDAWRVRAAWLVVFAFLFLVPTLLGAYEIRTGRREITERLYGPSFLVDFLLSFFLYMKFLPGDLARRFRQGIENGLTALIVALPFLGLIFTGAFLLSEAQESQGIPLDSGVGFMFMTLLFVIPLQIVLCYYAVEMWRNRQRPVGRNLAAGIFAFFFAAQINGGFGRHVDQPLFGLFIVFISYAGAYVLYHAIILQDEELFKHSRLSSVFKWPYRAIRWIFRPRMMA